MAYFGELYDENDSRFKQPTFRDKCARHKRWIIAGVVGILLMMVIVVSIVCTIGKSSGDVVINGILTNTGGFSRPDFNAGKPAMGKFRTTASAGGATKLNEGFKYPTEKIRGVNLGGWLVVEPSITPSMFTRHTNERVPDEWTLCEKLGREKCGEVLTEHYKTFITENEIKELAKQGINHVRIPIGYWSVNIHDDEPYVYGSWEYLLKGVEWCAKYGLRVMIDFHAAPGSQNGYASSGKSGLMGLRNSTDFTGDRKQHTHRYNEAFDLIYKYFFNYDSSWKEVVTLFNLVDNPTFMHSGSEWNGLMMYIEKLHQVRSTSRHDNYPVVSIHDFSEKFHWEGIFHTNLYPGVVFDYRNPVLQPSRDILAPNAPNQVCDLMKERLAIKQYDPKIINGALSLAFNGCGTNIDDIKKPAVTLDCKPFTDLDKIDTSLVKDYARKLISSYEHTNSYGWFFWTLKTENNVNPLLSYQVAKQRGWLPDKFDDAKDACTF